MLIDVHAHLDSSQFRNNLGEVLGRAQKAGLKAVINCGLNPKSNRLTKSLAEQFPLIKPAYGYYPTDAEQASPEELKRELDWIKQQNPIAISEIGLDGKHGRDIHKQKIAFEALLNLAKAMDKPAIIHTRQKEEECFKMIEKVGNKRVVLHCFTGSLKLAEEGAKRGWLFSIPPAIKYLKCFQELVKSLPLKCILTETDSPYLGPDKGSINEPANVVQAIKAIAEIKGITPEETERLVFLNYQRLF